MAANPDTIEAMHKADEHVRDVLRTFMRVSDTSQQALADALGMSQTQVSRRLNVPGALSYAEMAAIAAFFGVSISTFDKPLRQAVDDLLERLNVCLLVGAARVA